MIYVITGVPGSGKTLLAVQWITDWLAEGRTVYSDIDGIQLAVEGCSPDDWRDTPHGSVVVYDEAQGRFGSTGKPGRPTDPVMLDMETHRHSGHDLVFITQNSTMIHHHIRKLTGRHHHVQRIMGGKAATLFSWYEATDERDRSERAKADKETWRFPKQLFAEYQSATVHTHKFRMPRKLIWIGAGILAAIVIAGAFALNVDLVRDPLPPAVADESSSTDSDVRYGQTIRTPTIDGLELIGSPGNDSLDGSRWSQSWRITGVIKTGSSNRYVLSGNNDSIIVPNDLFAVVSYDSGVLKLRSPGGYLKVTAVTGPYRDPVRDYRLGRDGQADSRNVSLSSDTALDTRSGGGPR